ncbi:MAG: response regulator transcription factor [Lachnospiraceae bacterium]|jgi:DNA-binding response OmpR family regulator|nr:response regulator transcription factor [Lachnospiraceae bacterium]MCI9601160.1 response regulator transcription factor [Lachnospiraceae bacterium]MDE6897260.1 response regulator transcription factor [Lachnospiraceae bacterium]
MRILLVEDDEKLNQSLAFQLEAEGFMTDSCRDGEEALYYIGEHIHDLILLDRMLPGLSGTQVLQRMREDGNQTPVILITALGTLDDKVTGLDLGADDYLVKPFAFEELMARIRCVTRRPRKLQLSEQLSLGNITYQTKEKLLTGPEKSCSVSGREGALLETFLRSPGQTLSRTVLLTKVWGMDSDVENGNLDNYIHFLRRRLKTVGSSVRIQTVRGIGYRLE